MSRRDSSDQSYGENKHRSSSFADNKVCEVKVKYSSYTKAEKVAKHLRNDKGWIVGPYRCDVCGMWHNGESKPKPRKTKKSFNKFFEDEEYWDDE